MNSHLVLEAARASLAGSLPFTTIVRNLIGASVEYYHVDYISLRFTFYGAEKSEPSYFLGSGLVHRCVRDLSEKGTGPLRAAKSLLTLFLLQDESCLCHRRPPTRCQRGPLTRQM